MVATSGVSVRVVQNNFGAAAAGLNAAVVKQIAVTTYAGEARAKQLAPVLTGTLRRSIHSVFTRGGLTGTYGPSVAYGFWVEFGTRYRAARPFMRPSAELILRDFVPELRRLLSGRFW
jgi:HK97 gp10 family phage protein